MAIFGKKDFLFVVGGRKKERPAGKVLRSRVRNGIIVVVALTAGIWAVRYSQVGGERMQALVEILGLQEAVREFIWDQERCPQDLSELRYPPAGGQPYYRRGQVDPWGQEYRMSCPGRAAADVADIVSAGPDREFYTADDVKPH